CRSRRERRRRSSLRIGSSCDSIGGWLWELLADLLKEGGKLLLPGSRDVLRRPAARVDLLHDHGRVGVDREAIAADADRLARDIRRLLRCEEGDEACDI